jgi:twitching motility protein PilT
MKNVSLHFATTPPMPVYPQPNISRSAAPPPPNHGGSPGHGVASQTVSFDSVLTDMLNSTDGVSDLLFVVNRPPQVEAYGKLRPVEIPQFMPTLQPAHTKAIAEKLMGDNERLKADFKNNGSCDTSYAVPNVARFRVNIYKTNGHPGIIMRKLSTEIPSIEGLKLPAVCKEIIKEKTGLVFVTGATGSGKTTTLAAMLNELNATADIHMVTLEDPIEFLHPHKRATFSQRELGKDFSDFATGLRAALRQAPKVILVGEIRDRETMEIALTAAETGHVVYATLHTISAAQSINRVIGLFSKDEEQLIRQRLADTLRYVMSQRLAPKIGGGRCLVSEVLGSNLRTREAILLGENEIRDFHDIIEAGYVNGWHSFEQSLVRLYREQKITEETAMLYSVNKPAMRKAIDLAKKEIEPPDESPTGFKLNFDALHLKAGEAAPVQAVAGAPPPAVGMK